MFRPQMFQKNSTLHIHSNKPLEPLEIELERSRICDGDFLLHVSSECSEISLYQIQSTQLVHKGHLQNEALINAANSSIECGARNFKEVLWEQAGNGPYTFCKTVTPHAHLSMTSIELTALIKACRLPSIAEELLEPSRKSFEEQTSPSTVSFDRSPATLQEDSKEFDFAAAHGGQY